MTAILRSRPRQPHSLLLRLRTSARLSTLPPSRFHPSQLDNVEHPDDYCPGGLHPVALGDTLGAYRVLHKLGHGGASTAWLARGPRGLVALSVLRADASAGAPEDHPAVAVPRAVRAYAESAGKDAGAARALIRAADDHFVQRGPNGAHLCLAAPLAGPSALALCDAPGRVSGARRLRGALARRAGRQAAAALALVHAAGFVHGDVTPANVLFRLAAHVARWSDADVYAHLGHPEADEIVTGDGSARGPHAPAALVAPVDPALLAHASLLAPDVLLADFGQAFRGPAPPPGYAPATAPECAPPEARFAGTVGAPADVWGLACTLFALRAGFPLFEAWLGGRDAVLKEVVATLGRLPAPWWAAFDARAIWFHEDGRVKAAAAQDTLVPAEPTSIAAKLESVGTQDEAPPGGGDDGEMMAPLGDRVGAEEVRVLGGLLGGMLRYRPEERMRIEEVLRHPWFSLP